jgi:hypothetical protein
VLKSNPNKFNLFLASLNDFRFSRGLAPIDANAIASSTGLRLADESPSAVNASAAPEKLGLCIATKIPDTVNLEEAIIEAPSAVGFNLAEPDAGNVQQWNRDVACPNNCVCASAEAAASFYASASAWGYGYASAQCADGTTIFAEAEAYAYAEAEAHAYAYAFAVACVEDPGPGQCEEDPKDPAGECEGLGNIDPVGGVIEENAGCFTDDGECAQPVPETVPADETSAPATSTDTDSETSTESTASQSENNSIQ